jgi:hypothetical protein
VDSNTSKYISAQTIILKTKAILVGKIGDLISGENIEIIPREEQQYEAKTVVLVRRWIDFAVKDLCMSFHDETASNESLKRVLNVIYFIYETNLLHFVGGRFNMAALPFDKWVLGAS